jgi:hypothetical protein
MINNEERAHGIARLNRQFMVPDIYQTDVWQIETSDGTELVPVNGPTCVDSDDPDDIRAALSLYVNGKIQKDEKPALFLNVWLARLSAPGYMDCTDWTMHETRAEAESYLVETFGDW